MADVPPNPVKDPATWSRVAAQAGAVGLLAYFIYELAPIFEAVAEVLKKCQ